MPNRARPPLPRPQWPWHWLLPALIFLLLAGATLALWHRQSQISIAEDQANGSRESAAHTAEISERLKLHAQFLRSLQAFAATSRNQDVAAWRRFTGEIDIARNLPGLLGFAYAPLVQPDERPAFVAAMRRQDGLGQFAIFPTAENQAMAPVIFSAPDSSLQRQAIGFDMLSEAVRREAIDNAIARRDVALSGRVVLLFDQNTQRSGFLLVQAVYRSNLPLATINQRRHAFAGLVLTAYRMDEFINSLNRNFSSHFSLQIFDDGSSDRQAIDRPPTLIFDSDPEQAAAPNSPLFHHELEFGDRNWILHFRPRPEALTSQVIDTPQLILLGGLLGSSLLSLLVFYLTTHRARAERYARQITGELRTSEERFRLAAAGSNDGLWDQNLLTGEDYISPRLAEIFAFPPDEAPTGSAFYLSRIHPDDRPLQAAALRRHFRDNAPYDVEIRIQKKGGDWAWVRLRGEAVRDAAGHPIRIAGSLSDITQSKAVEENLDRLRRLLSTTIGAIPLAVFVLDDRRQLLMINQAFCRLLHRPEEALLGQPWPEAARCSADDQRRLLGQGERVLSGAHGEPLEFRLPTTADAYRQIVARSVRALSPEGRPLLIGTLTDISDLRQAEAALRGADQLKQSVLDAATQIAIIATDPQGQITVFNQGAEKMLGYRSDAMVGRETPLRIHLGSEVALRSVELSQLLGRPISGFETFIAIAQQQGQEQREWTYLRADGQALIVNLVTTTQRDGDGKITGHLTIALDVTQHKSAETELRLHRDHLREMVSERTARLDKALRQAEAANRAKSEFLANMSHELRTPMHAILSFAKLGLNRCPASDDKGKLYFDRIGSSAERLLALINELLDLSKLEAGKSELQRVPIDLLVLLQHATMQLEPLIHSHQLRLAIVSGEVSTEIRGDGKRLEQVIFNLLANAIKFSPPGSTITIQFASGELPCDRRSLNNTSQPAVTLRFIDQGIGIPPGEEELIFEKFVQSSSTKTGAGGTGLGLAICREIVSQHRGTIGAANNPDGGACITLTLPFEYPTESPC